jgi:antitoxin component of RelBE/YafQ-DinJ toxin-antitoxin module
MQEGYQIIKLKNRVSDVLTQMSIKVSDVLTLLGQRCADIHQLTFKELNWMKIYFTAFVNDLEM